MKISLPDVPAHERAWLWLSFQRYALLLAAAAVAPVAAVATLAADVWWAWAVALVVCLRLGAYALTIGRRWPAKIHALRVDLYRLERGRFSPERVRRRCGDPCFRVVARESLRRSGVARRERGELVRSYAHALREERSAVVVFDLQRGELRRRIGDELHVEPLDRAPAPPFSLPSPQLADDIAP
jgi:signal transduction histidine kinase